MVAASAARQLRCRRVVSVATRSARRDLRRNATPRKEPSMRGRQVLMETLLRHGIEYLFGNPGTTESPIIESLQDYPQIRYVMALHEAVAVGAASYYAQASGRTGVVNLHVAP